MTAVRIIVATPNGEGQQSCDRAETIDGAHRWERRPEESATGFSARAFAEAPRPSLIVMWPRRATAVT